jgi:phytoene synthase
MIEGPAPGSLRWYAVLFAPAPARASLEAVYAFEDELRRVVAGAHEAAHARLGWWRGELDRLLAGRPTHPVAIALAALRGRAGVDLALLHEMLAAADLDLARMTYRSWTELEAYCFRAAGAPQLLLAAILADADGLTAGEREFARRLGSAVRQVEMLRDLRADVAAGRWYAPLDALEAVGLDGRTLAAAADEPVARRFLAHWCRRLQADLDALPVRLDGAAERARQRPGLVLGALHARLLARLAREPPGVAARATLPPFERLWTSWRTALRHA